nr:protein FAM241B-like [Anolis sagrei ordinatus]
MNSFPFPGFSPQAFFNTNAGPAPQQHYEQQQQQQRHHHPGARPGERSPFSDINQQLVNMGFPTWNLGNQVVEPVMSILLLFLLMMVGVRGLLLVGLIYVVSHLSQR